MEEKREHLAPGVHVFNKLRINSLILKLNEWRCDSTLIQVTSAGPSAIVNEYKSNIAF